MTTRPHGVRVSLRIAWTLEKAAIRAQLGYRANYAIMTITGVLYQGSGLAFLWVVLDRFHTIDGWTLPDIAFLYSLRLLAHAVWLVPGNQVEFLDALIRDGEFDRFLTRPLNPLLQVMTHRFQINVLGDVVTAVALFATAAATAQVSFSPLHVVYLVAAVIGGALAEGALVLCVSSLSFRFLQTWAAQYLVDQVYLLFGSYPTRAFGTAANWVLTWMVPVAFVAYIPSSALLGRTGALGLPAFVAWGAPVVGLLWFAAAYRVWMGQLSALTGSGT
jgi:ABC-2 type transport system permease protein